MISAVLLPTFNYDRDILTHEGSGPNRGAFLIRRASSEREELVERSPERKKHLYLRLRRHDDCTFQKKITPNPRRFHHGLP
jgi:phage protein U